MTITTTVTLTTGDVRVNGEVVPDGEKTSHVEVKALRRQPTKGRTIIFKDLKKGFSKEVKVTKA